MSGRVDQRADAVALSRTIRKATPFILSTTRPDMWVELVGHELSQREVLEEVHTRLVALGPRHLEKGFTIPGHSRTFRHYSGIVLGPFRHDAGWLDMMQNNAGTMLG
jgi:hypothetical protein